MRFANLLTANNDETPTSDDGRPIFAIGHVPLTGNDIGALGDFYASIGFRKVARLPGVAILESRGGTHVAISSGPTGVTTLDLMVRDPQRRHPRSDVANHCRTGRMKWPTN